MKLDSRLFVRIERQKKRVGKTLGTSVDNSCSLVIKSIKTTRPPI